MPVTLDELKEISATLDFEDRKRLADFLLRSLDEDKGELSAAWRDEIDRRMADMRAGRVVGVPAAQVSAELRAKYA